MENVKYIRDSIYGNLRFEGVFVDLIESPEMQRLHGIKQLGFAYLVYPGANHTRMEHSLGVSHVAREMAHSLDMEEDVVAVAALLHDIGHGPFSHTLEYLMHSREGKNHVEITKEIISGERRLEDYKGGKTIKEILSEHGMDAREILEILEGKKEVASQIIHGPLDADQMDYLMRDAYYTGVAYGVIDMDRIIQTMKIHDNEIVFERKGVSALESMLVARALMYSSVYLHKTVRIAELMLIKAVERAERFDFTFMTDCELLSHLREIGGYQGDMVSRLKYRRLFKRAFAMGLEEMSEEEKEAMASLPDEKQLEEEISAATGVPEEYIIVDIPGKDIFLSEPRIRRIDIKVMEGSEINPLSHYTPLATALQMRGITEWAIMVSCPEEYREKVAEKAEKVIFGW